tara:strand:+ start:1473 stop:2372 length:900 start_codon:yes stop_codon:yes gene_type:complete
MLIKLKKIFIRKSESLLRKLKFFIGSFIRYTYNCIFKISFFEKPLPKVPFSKRPLATKKRYIKLHQETISNNSKEIIDFEKKIGFAIDKEWFSELSLITQTCIKKSKLNFNHGRLLFSVLSKYLSDNKDDFRKPIFIFETGTARGFSSICMSKALNDQKVNGQIITIDCIPHNQKILWNSIIDNDGPSTRAELLSLWPKELENIFFIQGWSDVILNRMHLNRIHFAFLDAQHTRKAVLEEFNFVSKKQMKGDIIIFDDVTKGYFDGVCEAVCEIEKLSNYSIKYYNFDNLRGYAIATKK